MNKQGIVKTVAGLVVGGSTLLGALVQWERPPTEQRLAVNGSAPSVVYADKLAGGLPTVCSGHTDWNMRVGTPFTREECARIDQKNAESYATAIIQCTGHSIENPVLNQHRLDALTLFAINVGKAGACGSRAVKLIKQGRAEEGCKAIAHGPDGKPVWSYVNKTTFVRGLYNRRLFERDWCLKPMPAPASTSTKGFA